MFRFQKTGCEEESSIKGSKLKYGVEEREPAVQWEALVECEAAVVWEEVVEWEAPVEPYSSVDVDAIVELDVPLRLETLPEHVKMKITPVVTTQVLNGHT